MPDPTKKDLGLVRLACGVALALAAPMWPAPGIDPWTPAAVLADDGDDDRDDDGDDRDDRGDDRDDRGDDRDDRGDDRDDRGDDRDDGGDAPDDGGDDRDDRGDDRDDGGDDRDDGGDDPDDGGDDRDDDDDRARRGPTARPRDRLPRVPPPAVPADAFVRRNAPRDDGARGREAREDEITALGLRPGALAALEAAGFRVVTQRPVGLLGGAAARLAIPARFDAAEALEIARGLAPGATIDFNHLYRPLSGCAEGRCYGAALVGFTRPVAPDCAPSTPIGLVDTGLDARHATLADARITQKVFLRPGDRPAAPDHGTAVASLLVGQGDTTGPLAPRAILHAAAVFARTGRQDRADAISVVEGLDWVVSQGARIVNMSLMGADNALLSRATAAAVERGVVVVAAAGNDGPEGPPRFPAAYDGVIGVAAVDRRGRPYAGGNRGAHVDFVAPGVDVWAAGPDRGGAYWTGTSFAAPFVAAAAAWARHAGAARDGAGVERALRAGAVDLGAKGRDPVFGWGLATFEVVCGR